MSCCVQATAFLVEASTATENPSRALGFLLYADSSVAAELGCLVQSKDLPQLSW